MLTPKIQVSSIVLPTTWTLGTETETIDDLVEHTSIDIPVEHLQEKQVYIVAIEVALAPASVPGNLWCWIELSPVASVTSTAYWAAIGGGGGDIAPTAPLVEASGLAAAAGTLTHGMLLPWTMHSSWARVVVQTPVAAALPLAYWTVQVLLAGKTP